MKLLLALVLMLPTGALAFPHSICGRIGGYRSCVADYGPDGNDLILVKSPMGTERMRVVCNTKTNQYTWESFGPNTEDFINNIANEWCSQ